MRFAAIDIGSNAIRLLLSNVYDAPDGPVFKKAELVRVPIRLGEEAFRFRIIPAEKIEALAKTMHAFRLLIEVFGAADYRACATSALRSAENGQEVVRQVKAISGIEIEVIDGKTEASIIHSNHVAEHLPQDHSYLYIDVGGGSSELTLFAGGKVVASKSFDVGTIRQLNDQVVKETWNELEVWIRERSVGHQPLVAIGSGGNVNKLFKMAERKEGKPLALDRIRELYDWLRGFTVEERIVKLGLNPDRADVIVPAARLFIFIMNVAGIDRIFVPQVGLADGIVHLLYEKYRNGQAR